MTATARRRVLKQDASNRALRTFIQGLAVDLGVAIVLLLATYFSTADQWSDVEWQLLALTLIKTVLHTLASYVMRRYIDPSRVPTPLPPTAPGDPATDDPAP